MNKRILSLVLVAVLILAGMILLPVAQGEPDHQDATAQQQTIDAVVQARFTQTADAQQQIAMTQAAQTQTAAAEPPSPPTQTAAFEATVNAAFFQAMTATVQVEMIAAVEARGLELITINNLARLEAIGALDQTARDVVVMAFGPGGKQLVTGSLRGPVRLWDAVSGAELTRFAGHSDDVTAVAINTDGRLIASAGKDGNVRLWDAASGGEVLALSIGVVHSLVFSPDGTKLATGDQNGMVYVWDTATGAQLQAITTPVGAVRALAFHPDNRQIAFGGAGNTVQIWDSASGTLVHDLPYAANVSSIAFGPDGRWLVAAAQGTPPRQWDALSGALAWESPIGNDAAEQIAFSPDGALIVASSSKREKITILDAASGVEVGSVRMGNPVNKIAFSPDGAVFAAASVRVRFWGVVAGSTAPAAAQPEATSEPGLPTLTPRPGATPRPEIFPTDVLAEVQIVEQVFEHGRMFWIRHNRQIWVMVDNPEAVPQGGDWYCYNDTFEDGEPETDPSLKPPDDLIQPRRGFGKLWRTQPGLQEGLGWGVTPEFDLVSYYTYIAGGSVQDGQYVAGPGEHRLTTLYGDSLSFFEREIRGDCLAGTWQKSGD